MPRKVVSKTSVSDCSTEDTPVQKPKSSHLNYIDKLPDDCVRIPSYLEHEFESLYYSPSNDTYYQAPKTKYRIINHGKTSFNCRSNADKTIRVSIKKLKKLMDAGSPSKASKDASMEAGSPSKE